MNALRPLFLGATMKTFVSWCISLAVALALVGVSAAATLPSKFHKGQYPAGTLELLPKCAGGRLCPLGAARRYLSRRRAASDR